MSGIHSVAINFSASIENYEGDRLRATFAWKFAVGVACNLYIRVHTYTRSNLKYNSFKMKSNLSTENCDCPVTTGSKYPLYLQSIEERDIGIFV